MATLMVRHKVKEFSVWKAAYEAFEPIRKKMGVTGAGAYQSDADPNEVTAYHHFATMDQAKAFAGSTELKEAMEGAGVVGPPDIWFGNDI